MVYKIINNRYRIFVESFILAVIILIIGFSLGYYVESFRTSKIVNEYKNYEVESLDLKLQNYYFQMMDKEDCELVIKENFAFADRIYDKGLLLEQYEEANQITDNLLVEKKKYVLLKTELWLNSILLRERCDNPFDTVVYFYAGDPANSAKVAEQKIISNVLKNVKEAKGNRIILLPIAADLKLNSIDLLTKSYNITSLPSILINEKVIIEGFASEEDIESYLGG